MQSYFDELVIDAANVRDTKSLFRKGVRLCDRAGFESFSISGISDLPGGASKFRSEERLPESYLAYYRDASRGRSDPVLQHCKHSHAPLCWDQAFYRRAGMADRWEEMSAHGLSTGVALALHLPAGRHVLVGLDRPGPPPIGSELDSVMGMLQMFAAVMADPVVALLCDSPSKPTEPMLTAQEVECLQWAMEGKTAYETSVIVRLSQSRINKILASAMRKLDCINKQHAVVKALRSGLL